MSDPTQPTPPEGDPFAPPPSDGVELTPPPPPPPAYGTPPPPPAYGTPPPAAPPAYGGAPVAPYGAPVAGGYGPAPQNGKGTTALVTGILGLLCCGILSIVAIVTGRQGMALADQGLANNRGTAQAGMILGWIGVALWVVGIVFYGIIFVIAATKGVTTSTIN